MTNACETERRNRERGFRKKAALHFPRDFKLGVETLLLLLDRDETLEILRHAIERLTQLSKLVATTDDDAMREVALIDLLGAFVEIVDSAGDGASDRYADEDRGELDDQEQRRHQNREQQHIAGPIHLLSEDHSQHRGGSGTNQQEIGMPVEGDRGEVGQLAVEHIGRGGNVMPAQIAEGGVGIRFGPLDYR